MEHILCRIEYISKFNPTCNILINNKIVNTFTGNNNYYEFEFSVPAGNFDFTIQHFGKNMIREPEKFIEIKKIFFNDIDIKNMIWDTTQIAKLPAWQKQSDFKWDSNLFLGHNGTISYKLKSPIIDFLLNYHQPVLKTSHGMSSDDNNFLKIMKEYFEKKIEEEKK